MALIYGYTNIYLMGSRLLGLTKIGISGNPENRLKTIRWDVPDVVLIDHVLADRIWEKELHLRYKDVRVHGEWFALTAAQILDIRQLFNVKKEWNKSNECYFTEGYFTACTKAAVVRG